MQRLLFFHFPPSLFSFSQYQSLKEQMIAFNSSRAINKDTSSVSSSKIIPSSCSSAPAAQASSKITVIITGHLFNGKNYLKWVIGSSTKVYFNEVEGKLSYWRCKTARNNKLIVNIIIMSPLVNSDNHLYINRLP